MKRLTEKQTQALRNFLISNYSAYTAFASCDNEDQAAEEIDAHLDDSSVALEWAKAVGLVAR